MKLKTIILIAAIFSCSITSKAIIKMPRIFSDHMVLQRNHPINVWGWGKPGEKVEVSFIGQAYKSKADKKGNWKIEIPSVNAGGPYAMTIKGEKNTIIYNNILMGDVWLCSGQSNMEWIVSNSDNAELEIKNANYPEIRHFGVKKEMSNTPMKDVEGKWVTCSPQTVGNFTAVGYFFGREIHLQKDVPIGLINASWGGTDIETWISFGQMYTAYDNTYDWEKMKAYKKRMEEMRFGDFDKLKVEAETKRNEFMNAMKNDKGISEKWYENTSVFTQTMKIPQLWENNAFPNLDGSVWFTCEFELPKDAEGKEGIINLAEIDDNDITYINEKEVGHTIGHTATRCYDIPTGILKAGKNTVVVNVNDFGGGGGLYGHAEEIYVEVNGIKYPLAGDWKYKVAVDSRDYGTVNFNPNIYPTLLFNAMISPITNYPIKGVIWYQGENNASRAEEYKMLFPLLINNWRDRWGLELPFYWVQLANFMAADKQPPIRSEWAELREAQTQTLSLPNTGQAVTIDIGDAKDIHPRNKQDVGNRLALIALKQLYGKKQIVYSGPVMKEVQSNGNELTISFDHVGSGLVSKAKDDSVEGFAIAGDDEKFVWADARIEGDKVIVWSKEVPKPILVRYAWGNNPENANLYNKEGLPACPFRAEVK